MPKRTIVVFANSIKHGQHCVAGKCLVTKMWIRPVADHAGSELTHDQVMYENKFGKFSLKTLQNIEMNLTHSVPLPHQPENHLVDNTTWQQRYSTSVGEISQFLDSPASLWGNGNSVSHNDILNSLVRIDQSLYLVQVSDLVLYRNEHDKRRAKFNYQSIGYDLPVTDPKFDKITTENQATSGVLCVSLGEPFNGRCYKLVAAIY